MQRLSENPSKKWLVPSELVPLLPARSGLGQLGAWMGWRAPSEEGGHVISHTKKCQAQENGWDERETVMNFGCCWPSPRLSSRGARACMTWTGSLQGWSQTSTESVEFLPNSSFISLSTRRAPCSHTDQPKGSEKSENEP